MMDDDDMSDEETGSVYGKSRTLDDLPDNQAELLAEFERRRRARQIHVSTDDNEVKANLRQLGEPICLFGEGPAERRERLKNLISRLSDDEIAQKLKKKEEQQRREEEEKDEVTWYHEGGEQTRISRNWIAYYSLRKAKERIALQKEYLKKPEIERTSKIQESCKYIRGFTNYCSQVGDVRPLSCCTFSPDSNLLAITSWSGACKLWTVPDCNLIRTYPAHACNAASVAFHPQATISLEKNVLNFVTSGFDGTVKLWNLENDVPIGDIEGHTPYRVSKAKFHPSGRFVATCCHDNSWRLYDLVQKTEVLHQEGHSRPVFDIAFQADGSLCATGGQDAYGRIWDLRTGRCVLFMEGHLKTILTVDFNQNGYQLASGSEDNSIKIWDIRQSRCIYTIPAHKNLVSNVLFEKTNGNYLISSSYDYKIKIWSHPSWTPLKDLTGHEQKIMGCDISPNNKWIASCSYDKTFKLWSHE